jgi:hypothetical protein
MRASLLSILGFAVLTASSSLAQMQDNREKQLSCNDSGDRNRDQKSRKCEVREETITSVRQLTVEPGRNGAVSVKGWTQAQVLVRAKLEAWGSSDSEASLLFSQIHADTSPGRIAASGPDTPGNSSWSVSYEIFVPRSSDLKIATFNGPVSVRDIAGRLELTAHNGPLELRRVVGDIIAKTTNGPIQFEPFSDGWRGQQLEFETTNGPVNIKVPAAFQAHVQAQTTNGPIQSEFGGSASRGNRDRRSNALDLNLGAGGTSLKITTQNGPIHLARI